MERCRRRAQVRGYACRAAEAIAQEKQNKKKTLVKFSNQMPRGLFAAALHSFAHSILTLQMKYAEYLVPVSRPPRPGGVFKAAR